MKFVPQDLRAICLYDGADIENFDIRQISEYLAQWFGPQRVQIRSEFFRYHLTSSGQEDTQMLVSTAIPWNFFDGPFVKYANAVSFLSKGEQALLAVFCRCYQGD